MKTNSQWPTSHEKFTSCRIIAVCVYCIWEADLSKQGIKYLFQSQHNQLILVCQFCYFAFTVSWKHLWLENCFGPDLGNLHRCTTEENNFVSLWRIANIMLETDYTICIGSTPTLFIFQFVSLLCLRSKQCLNQKHWWIEDGFCPNNLMFCRHNAQKSKEANESW